MKIDKYESMKINRIKMIIWIIKWKRIKYKVTKNEIVMNQMENWKNVTENNLSNNKILNKSHFIIQQISLFILFNISRFRN